MPLLCDKRVELLGAGSSDILQFFGNIFGRGHHLFGDFSLPKSIGGIIGGLEQAVLKTERQTIPKYIFLGSGSGWDVQRKIFSRPPRNDEHIRGIAGVLRDES